MHRIYQS